MNRQMAVQTIGYGDNMTCTISRHRDGQHEVSDLRKLPRCDRPTKQGTRHQLIFNISNRELRLKVRPVFSICWPKARKCFYVLVDRSVGALVSSLKNKVDKNRSATIPGE